MKNPIRHLLCAIYFGSSAITYGLERSINVMYNIDSPMGGPRLWTLVDDLLILIAAGVFFLAGIYYAFFAKFDS